MKQSIRLGRIGGVPVGVHWSVAFIFGLVTWELATSAFPDAYGTGSHPAYWVAAGIAAALFFASLLAHEGSHAVAARRHGIGVRSITLWLFGGVAQLEGEAHSPGADFTIAAVGPGMSVVLAGAFAGTQLLLEHAGVHGLVVGVCSWLWEINLLLAAFNLIPAAPLDGGRAAAPAPRCWRHGPGWASAWSWSAWACSSSPRATPSVCGPSSSGGSSSQRHEPRAKPRSASGGSRGTPWAR
jgi:Zn-dependent protease